ncbi:histidine kinase dimerization/phospho-acceptor domain-containing protein [Nocardioides acrostichi]|uniref:histidine kinase n=1 Tax=Nocardioides acrostichi TaxID=2784339 RepID=A0A930UZH9_9ACTN|nr:HAMP domain-containing sensor histidine kinase [Nocardioides acrostichi]MBF4160967.1 HAMP domain-containing histidine kinase [Nocardioides acrostichi]
MSPGDVDRAPVQGVLALERVFVDAWSNEAVLTTLREVSRGAVELGGTAWCAVAAMENLDDIRFVSGWGDPEVVETLIGTTLSASGVISYMRRAERVGSAMWRLRAEDVPPDLWAGVGRADDLILASARDARGGLMGALVCAHPSASPHPEGRELTALDACVRQLGAAMSAALQGAHDRHALEALSTGERELWERVQQGLTWEVVLPTVLDALDADDAWAVVDWPQPHQHVASRTEMPPSALDAGIAAEVLAHAPDLAPTVREELARIARSRGGGHLRLVPLVTGGHQLGVLLARTHPEASGAAGTGSLVTDANAARIGSAAARAVLYSAEIAELARVHDYAVEVAAMVGHDLRTPVAIAAANLELLDAEARADPGASRPGLDGLQRGVDRLTRLVDDMAFASSMLRRDGSDRAGQVDIDSLLDQILASVSPSAARRGVLLERRRLSSEPCVVTGHTLQLDRVFGEMLLAAVATSDRSVTVTTEVTDAEAVVAVEVSMAHVSTRTKNISRMVELVVSHHRGTLAQERYEGGGRAVIRFAHAACEGEPARS